MQSLNAKLPEAMFSPYQGKAAFERMYNNVKNAKKTVHMSIYSWSDAGITNAMEELLKANPEVELRVVLHRPLAAKEKTLAKVQKLEKLGAMFKRAKMNMHEKFILVDSHKLVNSSANMSGGAKSRYSEDFIFIDSEGEEDNVALLRDFQEEFAYIWNTSDDIVTAEELKKADTLKTNLEVKNLANNNLPMTFHSSSMNFNYKLVKQGSALSKKGRLLSMKKRKLEDGELPFAVSTALIKSIDNATTSIRLSLNHFNLYSVSLALIRAVERGVEIKLAVDNQEFKERIRDEGRKSIEMTPRFIRDWKKLEGNRDKEAPVRIKFYSLAPHHSSWMLNHHKYILIDIETEKPVLLAGSFNLSKNAEFNQFDNLVEYKGETYISLMTSYKENHDYLWNLNRDNKDLPDTALMSKFTNIQEASYVRIHAASPNDAISLTWKEAVALKKKVGKVAPGIFRGLFQNKGCAYYDFKKKTYFGGRGCQ